MHLFVEDKFFPIYFDTLVNIKTIYLIIIYFFLFHFIKIGTRS
jgi:hypothetical protein